MRCPECERPVSETRARYCGRCGARVPDPTPTPGDGRGVRTSGSGLRPRISVVIAGLIALATITIVALIALPLDGPGDAADPAAAEPLELGLSEAWSTSIGERWERRVGVPATGHGRVYTTDGGAIYALDASNGDVRWRYAEREPVWTEPTVIGNHVIGATSTGLVALDTADGRPLWRAETEEVSWRGVQAAPRVVVAGGMRGTPQGQVGVVAVFDELTGAERWVRDLDGWLTSPPTWSSGTAVAATQSDGRDGGIIALDGETGAVRWQVGISGWSEVIVRDEVVYAATPREAVAVDLHDGTVIWRTGIEVPDGGVHVTAQLSLVGDELRLAFPYPEPMVVALDPVDGVPRWQRELTALGGDARGELATTDQLDAVVGVVDSEQGVIRAVDGQGDILWEQHLDRPLGSGIALSPSRTESGEGDVWVGTVEGSLVALDLATGASRWLRRLPPSAGWEPALASGGGLVLANQHSDLVALSAADGTERWRSEELRAPGVRTVGPLGTVVVPSTGTVARRLLELDGGTGSVVTEIRLDPPSTVRSLASDREQIYAGTSSGVFAFDPTHRRERWFHGTWADVVELESDGGRLVAADEDGRVHLISAEDGTARWMRRVEACTAPRLADDTVVVGTPRGVIGLDLATGRQRWRIGASRPMCTPIAVGDGDLVYLTDLVRTVIAVTADDGERVWRTVLDHGIAAPPGAAPHVVAIGDATGDLHLLDPTDGSTVETLSLPSALILPPVVHPDGIVLLDDVGEVHGLPTGP